MHYAFCFSLRYKQTTALSMLVVLSSVRNNEPNTHKPANVDTEISKFGRLFCLNPSLPPLAAFQQATSALPRYRGQHYESPNEPGRLFGPVDSDTHNGLCCQA